MGASVGDRDTLGVALAGEWVLVRLSESVPVALGVGPVRLADGDGLGESVGERDRVGVKGAVCVIEGVTERMRDGVRVGGDRDGLQVGLRLTVPVPVRELWVFMVRDGVDKDAEGWLPVVLGVHVVAVRVPVGVGGVPDAEGLSEGRLGLALKDRVLTVGVQLSGAVGVGRVAVRLGLGAGVRLSVPDRLNERERDPDRV